MIQFDINSENGADGFLLTLQRQLEKPRALNAALGSRLADELVAHFEAKDQVPNKLGGTRTHFWGDIARATQLRDITDAGSTVAIADGRFALHLFGGQVRAKESRYLTIPMAPEAHGRRASVLEDALGIELFVAETEDGDLWLASEKGEDEAEFWYLLALSAQIPKDPVALPAQDLLSAALGEEVDDFFARLDRKAARKSNAGGGQ